jgi:sugar phosphate isomerase/epimerase
VNTLPKALQLISDSGRSDAVICLDPYQYFRAGHAPELLKQVDARLLPYSQITDGVAEPAPGGRRGVGRGAVPLKHILDALPPNSPLSLEWGPGRGFEGSAADWAKHALDATRAFLQQYYTEKA